MIVKDQPKKNLWRNEVPEIRILLQSSKNANVKSRHRISFIYCMDFNSSSRFETAFIQVGGKEQEDRRRIRVKKSGEHRQIRAINLLNKNGNVRSMD